MAKKNFWFAVRSDTKNKGAGSLCLTTRYLWGEPITIDGLPQVLRIGKQRQRTATALELAIRQPGTALFNTSAPGFRQQALLN